MNSAKLDELEKAAKAATRGPQEARYVPSGMPTDCVQYGVISLVSGHETCRVWTRKDVEFYAAASPDTILEMVRELRVLEIALAIGAGSTFRTSPTEEYIELWRAEAERELGEK